MNPPIVIVQRIRAVAPKFDEYIERKRVAAPRKPAVANTQKAAVKAWEDLLAGVDPEILEAIAKEMK